MAAYTAEMAWKWEDREAKRMAAASAEWTPAGRLATRVRRAIHDVDVAIAHARAANHLPEPLRRTADEYRREASALQQQLEVAGRLKGPAQQQAADGMLPAVVEVEEVSVRLTKALLAGFRSTDDGVRALSERLSFLEQAYDELD